MKDIFNSAERPVFKYNSLIVDCDKYVVTYNIQEYKKLPLKQFQLIALLTSKPGTIFTRNQIFSLIWGYETQIDIRTVDVQIAKLRKLMNVDNNFVTSIKGVGYKLNEKIL